MSKMKENINTRKSIKKNPNIIFSKVCILYGMIITMNLRNQYK